MYSAAADVVAQRDPNSRKKTAEKIKRRTPIALLGPFILEMTNGALVGFSDGIPDGPVDGTRDGTEDGV